jgi:hypothetical protein
MTTVLLSGLAAAALLWAAGAGYAAWAVGRRWAWSWPALAPVWGLALLVVASDVPSFFLGARTWAWPLALPVYGGSAVLLAVHRDRLRQGQWWLLLAAVPSLLVALWPMLRAGAVTTLSRGNHDYAFYEALAQGLVQRGYGADTYDPLLAPDATAWILRHGGWRSGLSQVTACVGVLLRRPLHEVDGLLWAAAFASLPGAAAWALGLVRPRPSRAAQALVLAATALGSPALLLLRDTYASHLASLPLLLVWAAGLLRALSTGSPGLLATCVVTLGASLSILADGAPLLVALWGSATGLLALSRPWARGRILSRAVAAGALGVAVVPFMVTRMLWQLQSLSLTGYVGARGASAGGVDAPSGDLLQLLPPLLLLGTRPIVALREQPAWLGGVVLAGALCIAFLLGRLQGLRGLPKVLVGAVAGSYVLLLGLLQFTSHHYPAWKLALSVGTFIPVLAGLAVERGGRWTAGALATGWTLALAVTWAHDERTLPARTGIQVEQVELMRRLDRLQGDLHMVGTVGSEATLAWSLPLSLLASERGRPLHQSHHRYSYFTLSPPTRLPLHDGRREYAVVLSEAESDVEGPLLFQSGPVQVRDVTGPGRRALNFGYVEQGWFDPERDLERRYRWSRQSSAVRADFHGRGCWEMEVRSLAPEARLHVTLGARQWTWAISLEWKRFRLPAEAWGNLRVEFQYDGPVLTAPGDTRPLRFAVASPRWVEGCGAP